MLECVVNISEGRDLALVDRIASAAGPALLDLHSDPHHHRSVLTLVGEEPARAVTSAALAALDVREHAGIHPRMGVVDVVPFVALDGSEPADAVRARDDFALWLASTHGVPTFLYGPERTLPAVRRDAFDALPPAHGPAAPHPSAGATAVGARPVLVAYNLWISGTDLAGARRIAAAVRTASLRALGLQVGHRLQVSMNLIEPAVTGPGEAVDAVTAVAADLGATVDGAELVGLLPDAVLRAVPADRWRELDLGPDRTIEARVAAVS